MGELERVVVAGGFGAALDLANAQRIGLLPPIPKERIVAVGNAAGRGALEILLLDHAWEAVERIRQTVLYVELSTAPAFQDLFVEHLLFKGIPDGVGNARECPAR